MQHGRPSASRCPGMPRGRRGGPTPGFEGASAATRPRPPCPAGRKNGLRPRPLRVTVSPGRPAGGCHVFFGPRRIERAALRKRATRSDLATQNRRFLRFFLIEGIVRTSQAIKSNQTKLKFCAPRARPGVTGSDHSDINNNSLIMR